MKINVKMEKDNILVSFFIYFGVKYVFSLSTFSKI